MMTADEIESEVLQFLRDECGAPEDLGRTDPLFSSGTLDSLDIISLVSFIDSRFDVRVPPLEVGLDKMDTCALITELVVTHRKA